MTRKKSHASCLVWNLRLQILEYWSVIPSDMECRIQEAEKPIIRLTIVIRDLDIPVL